jgi:hypothetical protein
VRGTLWAEKVDPSITPIIEVIGAGRRRSRTRLAMRYGGSVVIPGVVVLRVACTPPVFWKIETAHIVVYALKRDTPHCRSHVDVAGQLHFLMG